jgi:hypothetical protein
MQFSNLILPKGAGNGARAETPITPHTDRANEISSTTSFQSIMGQTGKAGLSNELDAREAHVSEESLVSDVALTTINPLVEVQDAVIQYSVHIGEGAVDVVSRHETETDTLELESAPTAIIEAIQSRHTTSKQGHESVSDAIEADSMHVDDASDFPTSLTNPLGISQIEHHGKLLAAMDTQNILGQNGTRAAVPTTSLDDVIALSTSVGRKEFPILGESAISSGNDGDTTPSIPNDSLRFKLLQPELMDRAAEKRLNHDLTSMGMTVVPDPKGMDLTVSASTQNGQHENSILEVSSLDAMPSGAELASNLQKSIGILDTKPAQGQIASQSSSPILQDGSLRLGAVDQKAEKQDGVSQNSPTLQPQTPVSHTVAIKQEFLPPLQPKIGTQIIDDGVVAGEGFVTTAPHSPIEAALQASVVPTAAERHAAPDSGVTGVGALQTVIDASLQTQNLNITSLYGSVEGAFTPLDQMSQIDSLNQTARIELPARLAAQIADIARQLPDGPIEISLSPEELGKVKLTFQVSENGAMNVVVAAERPETLEFMRRNVDSLLAEFSDLGYEGSSFQFQQDGENPSSDNADQQGSSESTGTNDKVISAEPSKIDAHTPSIARLHLDGTSGIDIRL